MIINSGIKEIEVTSENGNQLAVLKINVNDSNVANRFNRLIQNLEHVSDEFETEVKEKEDKYKDRELVKETDGVKKIDTEQIADLCSLNVRYINRCIEEINAVFGENTIQNVYKECYELNEDFVPDEELLLQFVDGVIPEMNKLFEQKFERNKKRYSPANKGKKK